MTPQQFQNIMIENGANPLGEALWARQALIGASLDARDIFHAEGAIDDEAHESFCDVIVDGWPEQ